jgi:hypothetical protein
LINTRRNGVLAGARRDDAVGVALLPQEAEDGVQRREADRPLAQPFGVQPVLVEPEPRRQDVRDALMKAGDEHSADAGLSHRIRSNGSRLPAITRRLRADS